MCKAIEENKQKIVIKRLVWECILYWQFMYTDKSNDKNKTKLLLPSFHSFINCWKTTKSMNLKFSDFQFVFIDV